MTHCIYRSIMFFAVYTIQPDPVGSQIRHLRLGIRHLRLEIRYLKTEIRHPIITGNLSVSVLEYICDLERPSTLVQVLLLQANCCIVHYVLTLCCPTIEISFWDSSFLGIRLRHLCLSNLTTESNDGRTDVVMTTA